MNLSDEARSDGGHPPTHTSTALNFSQAASCSPPGDRPQLPEQTERSKARDRRETPAAVGRY